MAHFPLELWSAQLSAELSDSESDSDVEGVIPPAIPLPSARGLAGTMHLKTNHAASSGPSSAASGGARCRVKADSSTTEVHPNDTKSMAFAQSSLDTLLRDYRCGQMSARCQVLLQEMHSCLVHTVARVEQQAKAASHLQEVSQEV